MYQSCRDFSSVPTTCVRARSDFTTLPRGRGQALDSTAAARDGRSRLTRTNTRSLCMAVPAELGDVDRLLLGIAGQHTATSTAIHQYTAGYVILVIGSAKRLSDSFTTRPARTSPRSSRRISFVFVCPARRAPRVMPRAGRNSFAPSPEAAVFQIS